MDFVVDEKFIKIFNTDILYFCKTFDVFVNRKASEIINSTKHTVYDDDIILTFSLRTLFNLIKDIYYKQDGTSTLNFNISTGCVISINEKCQIAAINISSYNNSFYKSEIEYSGDKITKIIETSNGYQYTKNIFTFEYYDNDTLYRSSKVSRIGKSCTISVMGNYIPYIDYSEVTSYKYCQYDILGNAYECNTILFFNTNNDTVIINEIEHTSFHHHYWMGELQYSIIDTNKTSTRTRNNFSNIIFYDADNISAAYSSSYFEIYDEIYVVPKNAKFAISNDKICNKKLRYGNFQFIYDSSSDEGFELVQYNKDFYDNGALKDIVISLCEQSCKLHFNENGDLKSIADYSNGIGNDLFGAFMTFEDITK